MKNRFISYLAALATLFTLAACTDDEPFDTITPDDQPCILDPIFRTARQAATWPSTSRSTATKTSTSN